jgi:hypothetical protein
LDKEGAMVSPFATSREHLSAKLARLDLVIQREVWRWRQMNSPQPQSGDEFRGLYVSESEVDAILSGVYPGSVEVAQQAVGHHTEQAFLQAIEQAAAEIERRQAASVAQGTVLRLERLCAMLGLDPFDLDVFLIGLAPELELRYERLYAYLQDDVTRKRPSVALALNLLCASPAERLAARARFSPEAPLLRHHLVVLFCDPSQVQPPLLALSIKPDPRMVDWVLGEGDGPDDLDPALRDFCELSQSPVGADGLYLPSEVKEQLAWLAHGDLDGSAVQLDVGSQVSPGVVPVTMLMGERGTGKRTAAGAVCAAWGRRLLTVHLPRVVGEGNAWVERLRLAVREAHLLGTGVYWQGYDLLLPAAESDELAQALRRDSFHAVLRACRVPSFLPVQDADRQPDPALLRLPCLVRVAFPRPSYPLRRALWAHLAQTHPIEASADLDSVAGRFRLTGGQIEDAVLDAAHRAAQRPVGSHAIRTEDLFAAARARTSDQLLHLAKKIEPRHSWEDLVLPADPIAHLHEMCDQMRHRPVVLGEWGFDRKLSLGKGLNALFAGPSGTGKTMAAEVIAHDLGLDLYKIDLSTVVSKYIGETEKNMERIFTAARNSNAILFFDEADALFGKRSEVRDAHDRYANVEISYLLQKMEEYDGLVVLTSNLNKNMDEAFVRRMHFTIEFPYPEEDARRRIWAISFPEKAPLAPDVDLGALATRFRLTGGNIRNIALTAAFLAARDGGMIGMEHLLWATRREFQKMGRLADEREFEAGRTGIEP